MNHLKLLFALLLTTALHAPRSTTAEPLQAGVAKIEITNPKADRVNDPCYAKALARISHHFFESSRFGGTWGRERESFGRSGGESALS